MGNNYLSELFNYISKSSIKKLNDIKSYLEKKSEENLERKVENAKAKLARDKEISLTKFYSYLQIPENATQEEINSIVLEKFKATSTDDCKLLPLSDAQLSDADFMLKLFDIRTELVSNYSFRPSEELQQDVDFMAKYTKIKFLDRCSSMHKYGIRQDFDYFFLSDVPNAENLFKDSRMLENLSTELPEENVLKVVKDYLFKDRYNFSFNSKKAEQEYADLINGCSTEFLSSQAEKFGKNFISLISSKTPNRLELMAHAVACDGFKSLSTLGIAEFTEVIESDEQGNAKEETILKPEVKSLILDAYEKDGFDELNKFVKSTLKPGRHESYMCHGEPHDYSYYSNEHANVQSLIMYDPDIYTIFATEYVKSQDNPEA